MRRKTVRILQRHTIWLSLLAHLLLFTGFSVIFLLTPKNPLPSSSPPAAVPSYLAESPAAPSVNEKRVEKTEPVPKENPKPEKMDKTGIKKAEPKQQKQAKAPSKPSTKPRKVSFASNPVPIDMTNPRDREPLRLIGESKIIKPLVKILARALSRQLRYPRVAAEFNLRGVVLVGFVLDPEGYVTKTRVVKTSGAGVLDDAARDAVGAMGPVGDVHEYVKSSEFLVVGIIFG